VQKYCTGSTFLSYHPHSSPTSISFLSLAKSNIKSPIMLPINMSAQLSPSCNSPYHCSLEPAHPTHATSAESARPRRVPSMLQLRKAESLRMLQKRRQMRRRHACFDIDTMTIYQYDCIDPTSNHPHCPKKCNLDLPKVTSLHWSIATAQMEPRTTSVYTSIQTTVGTSEDVQRRHGATISRDYLRRGARISSVETSISASERRVP
jgi:hypothetical protein